MMCGGTSSVKPASEEVQALLAPLQADAEDKVGKKFKEFTLVGYKTQVVAGTNYFAKVHIGDGEHIHMRVYRHFSGTTSLHSVQHPKTEEHEIEYF
ncbi:cystatin-B-like [Oratosquilla oratoria]|uniref:cystatin-B-like n=1 Tax=Oratosquilla oratoria TaxID=337810 RepID=UPI003F75B951